MTTTHVIHKSGTGPVWTLRHTQPSDEAWMVERGTGDGSFLLPRSEYIHCPSPEVWEDVTRECVLVVPGRAEIRHQGIFIHGNTGYRMRFISGVIPVERTHADLQSFLIVERRQS